MSTIYKKKHNFFFFLQRFFGNIFKKVLQMRKNFCYKTELQSEPPKDQPRRRKHWLHESGKAQRTGLFPRLQTKAGRKSRPTFGFSVSIGALLHTGTTVQHGVQTVNQHLQGNLILAALRNNDIRVFLAWLHKLLMHWLYRIHILVNNRI